MRYGGCPLLRTVSWSVAICIILYADFFAAFFAPDFLAAFFADRFFRPEIGHGGIPLAFFAPLFAEAMPVVSSALQRSKTKGS